MAVDSNKPYQRVSVQANHNDTIWNGAAWGAGAGIGAIGLTYGSTVHGARGLEALNTKVAGSKMTRMQTRNDKKIEAGKDHLSPEQFDTKIEKIKARQARMTGVHNKIGGAGRAMFGSKTKMVGAAAVGLMGGMLTGAIVDHYK